MILFSLFRRLLLIHVLLGTLVAAALSVLVVERQRELLTLQLDSRLRAVIAVLQERSARSASSPDEQAGVGAREVLSQQLGSLDLADGLWLTLIADDGTPVADSLHEVSALPNQLNAPEVIAAMTQGRGRAQRTIPGSDQKFLLIAERVESASRQSPGFIRAAVNLRTLEEEMDALSHRIWLGVATAVCFAFVVTFLVLRSSVRSLSLLEQAVRRMREGELYQHVHLRSDDEMGQLSHQFNAMSREVAHSVEQLRDNCRQFEAGSQRLATVLGAMVEGVIAVDTQEQVLFANQAARELLGATSHTLEGRPLWEAVRIPEIRDIVSAALEGDAPQTAELELRRTRSVISVVATRLPGTPSPGAALVFHDVTELRRLENLRREFVSNVSHELKTPLASIQAYTETLLDGALEDPEHNQTFIRRIEEQAERLHLLILDLLHLARIESGETVFEVTRVPLSSVVQACLQDHAPLSEAKGLTLQAKPSVRPVRVWADAEGLRTILDNLVENAINYTPRGGSVSVSWTAEGEMVRIDVLDTGVGIPEEHQPRVFERFYRVDKARSRAVGGTGLGLAIVKHLAQMFGGSVRLTSAPGEGSTFSVLLRRDAE